MKKLNLILLGMMLSYVTFGQNLDAACKCAGPFTSTKPSKIFHLSNGISIALCGYPDTQTYKGRILYSEFALSECGTNEDIKIWGALSTCDVKVVKDTLFIETIENLPVGKTMDYQPTVWTIERIYDKVGLVLDTLINPLLPKYNTFQVASTLNLYDHTPDINNDKIIELADKLLIAAISGSKKAKNYLVNFRTKFTHLDGVYLEEYDFVIRKLTLWNSKSGM